LNILIEYKDTSQETRHERAENIVYAIDSGALPTARITNYVLLESLNWMHERQRHEIAVNLRNRIRFGGLRNRPVRTEGFPPRCRDIREPPAALVR